MSDLAIANERIQQLLAVIGLKPGAVEDIRRAFPTIEPMVADILAMLMKREFVTRAGLYTVLYGTRPDVDMPDERTMDIQIMRLRRHLAPHGIIIETAEGSGWYMTKPDRAKLKAVLAVAQIPLDELLEAACLANDLYHKRLAYREAQAELSFA